MQVGILFDRLTNVALICAVGYGVFLSRQSASPAVWPTYALGDQAPDVRGIDYRKTDKTLMLYLSSTCRFCTESLPLYNRLVVERDKKGQSLRIVGITREPHDVLYQYLSQHKVKLDLTKEIDSPPRGLTVR